MPEWQQHLFSKRIHIPGDERGVDEFHFLTDDWSNAREVLPRIHQFKRKASIEHAAFIHELRDSIFIGVYGQAPDVLPDGKKHPHAYERVTSFDGSVKLNRRISFVHFYSAPKGTPIPDLADLLKQQPNDLEELLRRANAGEDPVKASSVSFGSSTKGSAWGDMADAFSHKKNTPEGAVFRTDGTFSEAIGAEKAVGAERAAQSFRAMLKGNRTAIIFAAGAAVTAAVVCTLSHAHRQQRQPQSALSR